MSRFKGRAAIVTGAGKGIGRACAERLAAEGAKVLLVARGPKDLEVVSEHIASTGGDALVFPGDVADEAVAAAMARAAVDAFGRVDVLVTCAAAGPAGGASESLAAADWRRVMAVDLDGTFYGCREVGRQMLSQRYGRIVNLASFHVVGTYPGRAAYAAAKSGVVGLTQALAVEWGGRGVTANAVAPGPVRTDRTAWFLAQDAANETGMVGRTPTGRIPPPTEVAGLVAFLASEEAGHVNGQTIVIDGGWTKNAWWGRHPHGV